MVDQQGRTVEPSFIAGLVTGEGSFILGVHKHRGGKTRIKPAFYMQMNDGETMELVYHTLKAWGQGCHLHQRPDRGCWQFQISGFERVKSFIKLLWPHLTGDKRKAASIVMAFINLRQQHSPQDAYTDEEKDLVRKLRAVNGNRNGRKNPL